MSYLIYLITVGFLVLAKEVGVLFNFYRDREKREIDFLIERDDGALLGIEVKSSASARKEDFKHLRWFQENLAGDRPFCEVVLYTGDAAASFGDNLWPVPIGAMWGKS